MKDVLLFPAPGTLSLMHTLLLVRRGLAYHWRTNAAVVLGVAVAVAVLAGALLVGDSVRASLRGLFLQRLGRAELVVTSANFFREQLAAEARSDAAFARAGFESAVPLVMLEGAVAREEGGARAAGVQVYGVDGRFWEFHGVGAQAPRPGEIWLSPALADELRAGEGETLLVRVEKPSDIPVESLHGRKEDVGRTSRLTVRGRLAPGQMGEFSVRPRQSAVRAAFVSLEELQRSLEQEGRVNALLVSAREGAEPAPGRAAQLGAVLKNNFALEDVGVRLRALDAGRGLALESESGLVGDALASATARAAGQAGARAVPVLSYLANSIRAAGREVPYSLVTAVDDAVFRDLQTRAAGATAGEPAVASESSALPPIILNEWAARELGARVGDRVALEYYLWLEAGRLATEGAEFRLAGVVPLEGLAADRDLVPEYPGITEARSLADWDPPFPVDLSRIRPADEQYWDTYRTTPKGFVTLERGQQLWQSRFGRLTSLRVLSPEGPAPEAFGERLRAQLDPTQSGMAVFDARAEGLEASQGATDFGEYFLYFSFFLVASALMLAALFFRLGVEQRLREVGILRAVGFTTARVRRIFLAEALVLAALGSALGLLGAYAYGALMMYGLRTWWVEAVGTTALALHATPRPFILGALGGLAAALVCIYWTLRGLRRASARALLSGVAGGERAAGGRDGEKGRRGERERGVEGEEGEGGLSPRRPAAPPPRPIFPPALVALLGLALLGLAGFGVVGQVAGFFGGGTLLLVALLWFQSVWLRGARRGSIEGAGWGAVTHLGARNATHRPGRSLLCITLIASAAFIIVAVDAFRREGESADPEPKSGTGGYALLAETMLPVVHDPNTPEGRDQLNLSGAGEEVELLGRVSFARFRLRPGDDASCLNLYRPRQPRILAPTDDFLRAGRFSFQSALAETPEEEGNPWLTLRREFPDGAVPVAADANSLAYVLHLKPGEDFLLERGPGLEPARLRVVAALSDSLFQGELLMSERNFLRLFPEQEGHRFFLLDLPEHGRAAEVAAALEDRLSDFGLDAEPTAERLAGFHRVENTFLSTFQMLGGLGLALGTLGLAAVLLRNVLERRRELALLRAVGYRRAHFALMVLAENALLLLCGLVTGTACALLAVVPVVAARGGRLPLASLGLLLLAVVVSGLLASLLATAAALRSPLLASLRAE